MLTETNKQPKTRKGDCECCPDSKDCNNTLFQINGRWYWACDKCRDIELVALANKNRESLLAVANVQSPVLPLNAALAHARHIDASIQVRTDLFNAATTAIVDLEKSIDNDSTIVNKPYALAEELMQRFTHFKQVIFDANETLVNAGNNQKAIQIRLNQLANQLRQDEREKLKIADINYKPTPPKVAKVKTVATSQTRKATKLDKHALRTAAAELTKELGQPIPEFLIQQYVVSKNMSVLDAARTVRQFILDNRKSS